jgi:hypothetical protein
LPKGAAHGRPAGRRQAGHERAADGLELVEPGVVSVNEWKPEPSTPPEIIDEYCAVGRKL